MIHEEELMKLCNYDTDLFLDIRSIFEQSYTRNNYEEERKILIEFIDLHPDVLAYDFDCVWKDFKNRYRFKYPEWFV